MPPSSLLPLKTPVTLRPKVPDDRVFLFQLFSAIHPSRLMPLPEAMKNQLLWMQFDAQQNSHLDVRYWGADFSIILYYNRPIGQLCVHRKTEEIHVMDIGLIPSFQNQGIGSALMNQLKVESTQENKSITLQVAWDNPVVALYQRLGFQTLQSESMYHTMAWYPNPSLNPTD